MLKVPLAGFALLAAVAAAPVAAQDAPTEAPRPSPGSTYVVPSGAGEAVRVTVYERRPSDRGRLARRYKGIRANRTARVSPAPARATPVDRVRYAPRGAFVQRYGSFFQVVPTR